MPSAAWVGALAGGGPPRWLAVGAVVLALAGKRRLLVALAVGALVASLAADAHAGLDGVAPTAIDGVVQLASDPEPVGGGWRAVVRWDGRRLDLRARGAAAGALQHLLAGESARVVGRVTPIDRPSAATTAAHLAGRLEATALEPAGRGAPAAAAANAARRQLARGASSLSGDQRALLLGVLVGDDRDLSPGAVDAARAAGLSHLTAVSGQNVVLLVGLLAPILRRLGMRSRLGLTLAVLGAFVVITRAEPSVLRAAATAGGVAVATAVGRPADGLRVLAGVVTALLLIDPLLVHALGFRLSVGATAGILVLSAPIAELVPGPRPLAVSLAVAASAQLAVAPLLLASGLPVPVVALPANVLAGPLAAAAMTWGMVAAPVAGWLGGTAATVVHLPTRLFVGGVLVVAERAAVLALGSLGWAELLASGAGLALALWCRGVALRRLGGVVVVAALVVAGVPHQAAREGQVPLGLGADAVSVDGAVVVVLDGRTDVGRLLATTRSASLGRPDLIVVRSPGSRATGAATALVRRYGAVPVAVPAGAPSGSGTVVSAPVTMRVGSLRVRVRPDGGRLAVEVEVDGEPEVAASWPASP